MKVYYQLSNFEKGLQPVATIGTFDGVHLGHRKIINSLVSQAKAIGGESVLISFHPHPRLVLFPDNNPLRLLQTLEEKIASIAALGVDKLLLIPFTREFSRLTSQMFIEEVLVQTVGIRKIVIGYDHQFGKNRTGNVEELREMGPRFGFEVEEIPALLVDDIKISSTKIRNAIKEGDMDSAAQYLGYSYSCSGVVVKGEQLGRQLGYPTANLQLDDPMKLMPAQGVYLAKAEVEDHIYHGLLSIGTKPTLGREEVTFETFLFHFSGNLYGKHMRVTPLHYLRAQQKFADLDELIVAMKADEQKGHSLLAESYS